MSKSSSMKIINFCYHLLVLHCLSSVVLCKQTNYIVTTFPNPHPQETFINMVRDVGSGKLFVAAVNNLYKFSSDLILEQEAVTGPKKDNPDCLPPPRGTAYCRYELTFRENYNKALVIMDNSIESEKRLISCSTLFHGYCEKRWLSNISRTDEIMYIPVVANNRTATTVVFIGPGPTQKNIMTNALYVGASWTNTGQSGVRDLVKAFSSRRLDNFKLTWDTFQDQSGKAIEQLHRQSFPIYYIYGVSTNLFSYIVTVQKSSTASKAQFISKLIRVCNEDEKFRSYTEVELQCNYGGVTYNLAQALYLVKPGTVLAEELGVNLTEDVLFGVFSRGSPYQATTNARESALCVFPMKEVRKMFTENIRKCFNGTGDTGPDYIVKPIPCSSSPYLKDIDDGYCGSQDFNTPINGQDPIVTDAALLINKAITTIIVTTTHSYTVGFLGTQDGHIIKVSISAQKSAEAYEEVVIQEGNAIRKNMYFDNDQRHLYAFTDTKIYKIEVKDCSQYKTCDTCLGTRDPYCGWCSLEDKCSVVSECKNHDHDLHWLEYSGQTCPNISHVFPDKIQKDTSKTTRLNLNISNLPLFNGNFKCAFIRGNTRVLTPANLTHTTNQITCNTPPSYQIPEFPPGADHVVMQLSVLMNNTKFVSTNFTIFDCEVHTKDACYKCTASNFNCTWCIQNHICTNTPLEDCSTNDKFISGSKSEGLMLPNEPGPNYCPTFISKKVPVTEDIPNILVPSGTSKKVSLLGKNIKDFQRPLHCVFSLGGEEQRELATVTEISVGVKVIECTNFYFYYPDNKSYLNVPLKVEWGISHKPLDNPSHLQIKMYKCEKMAGSCGECLVMDSGYSCGWCDSDQASNKVCSIKKDCPVVNNWLSSTETCPNPKILKIRPLTGPKAGGTELTIDGLDLGKTFDDIVSNVDVFGIQCLPIRDKYIPAVRIVCRTDVFHNKDRTTGPVRVTVNSRYPSESKEHFTYVDPVIESIQPSHGPQAGGTRVTINGQYMNAGTNITAYIGGRICSSHRESKSTNQFVCVTPSSLEVTSAAKVKMWFDRQLVTSDQFFDYEENPVIEDVNPKRSIRSGGITITVTGQNLDSVKNPKMVILTDQAMFEGDCNPGNSEMFTCLSPMIDPQIFNIHRRRDLSVPSVRTFHYGLRMDNVTDLLNLTKYDEKQFKTFSIYPDPTFEPFPGNKIKSFQKKNNEYLTISGQYLSSGIRQSDVTVKIGRGYCNVTSVGNQLTCQPPKSQPQSDKENHYPEVEIYIGHNLTIFIGYLKYEEAKFPLPLEYIILISSCGGVLFIAIIVVIIMYRFKSKKNDSMMKKMQIQMDNLEAKVAKECKEAFAELQTDMTELTSDLYGQVAIPFWDYRTYCMRVLFPKQDALDQDVDHPVIRDLEVDYARRESVERGLKQFAQMLNNKTFLLIFVRTLEGHKHFTMRDRVNVASLISVALQTKMEYATDILKTLLAELIEKSVEGKNHPKLLLRRTESVAEKMLTNWFTFLLYKFLRECAGEPLFMLYQAMKQQVSKGPVDNVTSEARYSLSEDKLIRQQIEYKQMTVYVQDMEQFGQQPHPVKVLDCDTIAQVKEKILDAIYKNAPFSSRPIKDDVDLVLFDKSPEWNSGIKGRLILQDDDVSTKIEGEYKRLNSCCHYKVPDGAFMTLVPKQPQSYYNLSMNSNDKSGSKLYSDFIYSRSPSLNRTPQGFHADTDGSGYKYYHLVKQHDAETLKEGDRGSKMVSEIYLTRLLATKGTLQQFVDDLFERIFSTNHRCTALPLAIKYMFDFLDDQALQHGIQDIEVVHTWKSNSLPLRFWVNVIKNPNFVFDIYKSPIVDSCLSVVAQTFMDSCSMSEHRLGKDSPSSKLLYAKDIPKYKKWVERYYQDIKMMPAISDQDMTAMMTDESRCHQDEFNTSAALLELYKYVQKYNEELWQALEEDEFAKKNRLTYKLEQVRMTMEAEVYC
ncbi:plexin-A4-like [Ylistrum balloti]|uniref:plexin-A4-like n=2 Tax=Ylistrum balloti TaxID=509963 RepID=UPI002905D741|nr:plexin-A4-like [Ylistrum balloti]